MEKQYSVVTRKGQITLPAPIRKALGLSIGDRVSVTLDQNGQLGATVRPARSVTDATFGALHSDRPPLTEDEIREAVWEHAAARDARSKRS